MCFDSSWGNKQYISYFFAEWPFVDKLRQSNSRLEIFIPSNVDTEFSLINIMITSKFTPNIEHYFHLTQQHKMIKKLLGIHQKK
mgnify:CR=1 FL=1